MPEWAGTVTLTVQRTNDVNTEVSVDYATANGHSYLQIAHDYAQAGAGPGCFARTAQTDPR